MSFKQVISKIKESQEFKTFKEKHKDAFLFSAFFTLNPELALETKQVDFYIKEKGKVETFMIDDEDKIKHKMDEFKTKTGKDVVRLNEDIKIDVDNLRRKNEKM